MARRITGCALLSALTLSLAGPLAPAQAEPKITILNPPSVVNNQGIPVEKQHFKLNQAVTPGRIPGYFCLPTAPAELAIPMHLVFKPAGPPDIFGTEGDGDDDLSDWVTPGFIGVPLPVDQIGAYEMQVLCAEAKVSPPPCCFSITDASVAYSVEPESYKTYIEADDPMAWWRLGDLPKGSTLMEDATGAHDGTYYNGPALDRDGAPNCNVEARATSGCNDSFIGGVTSSVLNDTDRAAFFSPNSYGAVQDFPAPTTPYTIEAWVNPYEAREQMIFQHGYGPALYMTEGEFVFRQTDTDVAQTSGDLPSAGDWFHVVGTWDGVSEAKLYVNGELVGSSSSATTPPSGAGSTLYLGNGHLAGGQTFHGTMDEVAYYDKLLDADAIGFHYEIATYVQEGDGFLNPGVPTPGDTELHMDVTRPKVIVNVPTQDAVFNAGKVPPPDYDYSDASGLVEDLSGFDVIICVPLPMLTTPGPHTFTVVCTDRGGNVKSVSRDYTVADFAAVVNNDDPIGYWRLGDASNSSVMAGDGGSPDGAYKNDTEGGPTGISGDADTTRAFLGQGGYGYVNGIEHPRSEYSMEAWIDPDDAGDAMIMQHGRGGALFIKDDRVVFRQTVTDVVSTQTVSGLSAGFHQVVGTWDGVNARLYIDGQQSGGDVYAPTPPSGFSTFYVAYGEYGPWFRGDLDEVSYYGTALDPNRVFEHFYADPPPGGAAAADIDSPGPSSPIDLAPSAGGSASGDQPAIPLNPGSEKKGPAATVSRAGKARISRKRGRLVAKLGLEVSCPAGAGGECHSTTKLSRRSGTARKSLSPGESWAVEVRLSRRAEKRLRRRQRVELLAMVAVQTPDGQHAVETARISLRRPARRSR